MDLFANIAFVVLLLGLTFFIHVVVRNNQVYKLRTKMLDEESVWIRQHIIDFANKKYTDMYLRIESLPSYERMVYSLWKPVSQFEKEAGDIEHYYKEVKCLERK